VTVSIRLATLDDVDALRALIEASVRGLSVGFLDEEDIEAELRAVGVDTQLIQDGTYYVATADGRIVAAGGWSRRQALHGSDAYRASHGPGADAPLAPGRDPARIRAMFVHPAWARRGIGRRLFETSRAAAQAEGFTSFILTATLPGVPLYEALGFTAVRQYVDELPGGGRVPVVEMRL
jgi:GNAT superfamily N-acetyltransferase